MKRFWWFCYWSLTGKAHPEHVKACLPHKPVCKVCGGECGQCGGPGGGPSYIWDRRLLQYVRNRDFDKAQIPPKALTKLSNFAD